MIDDIFPVGNHA